MEQDATPGLPDPATQPATPAAEPHPAAVNMRPAALDLDKLEREGAALPFDFMHNGRRFLMTDPLEVDWQDLIVALTNPHMFFKLVLAADDRAPFFSAHMPTWKMRKLMEAYQDHYGITDGPNLGGLQR